MSGGGQVTTLPAPDGAELTQRTNAECEALLAWVLDDADAPAWAGDPRWALLIADDGVLWCRRDAGGGWVRPSFGAVRPTPAVITPATLWEARVWGGDVEHHLWGDGAVSGRTVRLLPSAPGPSTTNPTAPADGVLRLAGRAQIDVGQAFARCTLPGRFVTVLPVVDGAAGDGSEVTLRSLFSQDPDSGAVRVVMHVFTGLRRFAVRPSGQES